MAKYRPISPENAWRSSRGARLEIEERYVEFYLLSSPFSNVIGCYPIVEQIASAEIGFHDPKKLVDVLERLQAQGIITYEAGYVLVRTWFFHNTYESAFQGNVAKAAIREVASLPLELREQWVASCIEAGVPEDVINQLFSQPLKSPSAGTSKGLLHNNHHKKPEQEQKTTTTTKQKDTQGDNDGGGSNEIEMKISLVPLANPHRAFIESALSNLPIEDAQMIADEVGGTLEAAARGERAPIRGLHGWLPTLVNRLHEGSFVPQWGPDIARKREISIKNAQQVIESAHQRQEENRKQEEAMAEAASLLAALNESDLQELAIIAAQLTPMRDLRSRIRDAVIKREIPKGLGKIEILKATREWTSGGRICA